MNLTKSNQKIVNVWANKLNVQFDDLSLIINAKDLIVDIIEDDYTNLETKKRHYSTLLSILRHYDDPDVEVIQDVFDQITEYLLDVNLDNEMKNNEQKNWVHFDEILLARDTFIRRWSKDPNNTKLNYTSLILSLYTFIPPVRLNYLNMKIISDIKSEIKSNIYQNLLMINNNNMIMYLNDDKHSNILRSKGKKSKPLITNVDGKLKKIIKMSLRANPREFLLTGLTNDKPMSEQIFLNLLHNVYENKKINVTMIRHSYITSFLKTNPSTRKKFELAEQMRHSFSTQSIMYNREIDTDDLDEISPAKINSYDEQNNNKNQNQTEYLNRSDNRYNFNRKRLIKKYNNSTTEPSHKMIIQYNLINNGGIWE